MVPFTLSARAGEHGVMTNGMNTTGLLNLTSRGTIWNLGNEMLYQLCRNHPDHKSPEVITAKVWLIGRSYAAAIERGRTTEEDGDRFYESRVVPKIQASRLDEHIDKVRQFRRGGGEVVSFVAQLP
jgi:hypothetical protein